MDLWRRESRMQDEAVYINLFIYLNMKSKYRVSSPYNSFCISDVGRPWHGVSHLFLSPFLLFPQTMATRLCQNTRCTYGWLEPPWTISGKQNGSKRNGRKIVSVRLLWPPPTPPPMSLISSFHNRRQAPCQIRKRGK